MTRPRVSESGLKTFSIVLEAEKAAYVKKELFRGGISLSRYLNVCINNMYEYLKKMPVVQVKGDVTPELLEAMAIQLRRLEHPEKCPKCGAES